MLNIIILKNNIILSGHLDGSQNTVNTLKDSFIHVPKGMWNIIAQDISVEPDGITEWIKNVKMFLPNHKLTYDKSQLGLILECDERYDWHRATFEDQYSI